MSSMREQLDTEINREEQPKEIIDVVQTLVDSTRTSIKEVIQELQMNSKKVNLIYEQSDFLVQENSRLENLVEDLKRKLEFVVSDHPLYYLDDDYNILARRHLHLHGYCGEMISEKFKKALNDQRIMYEKKYQK